MPTLSEIADWIGAAVDGDGARPIERLWPVEEAGATDLVFVKDERFLEALGDRDVGGVLCQRGDDVGERAAIRVPNPRRAAAAIQARLAPLPRPAPGRHPTAVVAADADVAADAHLGPFVVVESGARVGAGVVLESHVVVGAGASVGAGSWLHARVTLYAGTTIGRDCTLHAGCVLGGEGFGVEPGPDGPTAFPQRGRVVLGDGVRVGANTTIDRATFHETRIGDGCQIDNLVQVGHNTEMEAGVVVCALVGVAGGARMERGAVVGPQAALSPDSTLGPGTILGARAATISHQRLDDPGRVYMDGPPLPIGTWMRFQAYKAKQGWRRKG